MVSQRLQHALYCPKHRAHEPMTQQCPNPGARHERCFTFMFPETRRACDIKEMLVVRTDMSSSSQSPAQA